MHAVEDAFAQYGHVLQVFIPPENRSGCYAFIKYEYPDQADLAIKAMHNQMWTPAGYEPSAATRLRVEYAKVMRPHRPPRTGR